MELFHSPMKSLRPQTQVSKRTPDYDWNNPIDCIYMRETSISPVSRKSIMEPSKFDVRKSFSAEKNRFGRRTSEGYKHYASSISKIQPDHASIFRESMNALKFKKHHKRLSPKASLDEVAKKRDLRCSVINNLMTACNKVENSKGLFKAVEKEKQVLDH